MAAHASRLLRLVRGPEGDPSRGAVLDGALSAFLDLGIRRSSMSDIARHSGISPATLYRRFPGKAAVIEAVGVREVRRFLADADDVVAGLRAEGADPETILAELALAVVDGIRRNRLLQRLLSTEPEIVLPFLTVDGAAVITMGREYVAGLIADLQPEAGVAGPDPAALAEVIARLALSLALTPQTVLPLDDAEATRALLGELLAPVLRRRP